MIWLFAGAGFAVLVLTGCLDDSPNWNTNYRAGYECPDLKDEMQSEPAEVTVATCNIERQPDAIQTTAVVEVPPLVVEDVAAALEAAAEDIRVGNYAHAYLTWRQLAEQRQPDAEYNLGWIYHNGYGVAVDNKTAAYWWQRAAEHGLNDAYFDIGNLYYHGGKGIKRDYDQAIPWFMQAAEAGHDEAKVLLANLVSSNHRAVAEQRSEVIQLLSEAEGGLPLSVKPAWANLRAEPSATASLVKAVPRGTLLTKLNQQDNWLRVKISGEEQTAWIRMDLVNAVVQVE